MKLTFTQTSSESGSVVGDRVDWFWSGQDLEGPEDTIEELAEAFQDELRRQWPEIKEDAIFEIPATAEIEWPDKKVLGVRTDFDFFKGALEAPEDTKEEIGDYFSEPVEFNELVPGKNTAKVNNKTFEFFIRS